MFLLLIFLKSLNGCFFRGFKNLEKFCNTQGGYNCQPSVNQATNFSINNIFMISNHFEIDG